MQATTPPQSQAGWQAYGLDHQAQELVIANRDKKGVLTESHKRRMAVAYGLERFWGEHLRYEASSKSEDRDKGAYWKSVWIKIAEILGEAGIALPDSDGKVSHDDTNGIKKTANAIWSMEPEEQQVALMVLTQLCDSLVWWTQRYKTPKSDSGN
jgi:hypothetical protein